MVVVMLSLLEWPRLARLVRGQCLLRERDFMLATLGLSARRRLFGHLLPNTIPILVVMATMAVANAILSESALSYLGLGVVPPTPSGNMMDAANSLIDFSAALAVDAAGHRHLYHRDRHQRAGRWPARRHGSQHETEAEMTTPLVSFNHLPSFRRRTLACARCRRFLSPFRPGKPLAWWVNPAAAKRHCHGADGPPAAADGAHRRRRDPLRGPRSAAESQTDGRSARPPAGNDFQEPMSALNPVLTIGEQLCEPPIRHLGATPKAAGIRPSSC